MQHFVNLDEGDTGGAVDAGVLSCLVAGQGAHEQRDVYVVTHWARRAQIVLVARSPPSGKLAEITPREICRTARKSLVHRPCGCIFSAL